MYRVRHEPNQRIGARRPKWTRLYGAGPTPGRIRVPVGWVTGGLRRGERETDRGFQDRAAWRRDYFRASVVPRIGPHARFREARQMAPYYAAAVGRMRNFPGYFPGRTRLISRNI